MLTKKYTQDRKKCRVTFKLPEEVGGDKVQLYGEFNDWVGQDMKKQKTGNFSLSITLPAGRKYQFRYLLDGNHWENDPQADAYVPNPYGTEDSVLDI